jgi:lipopolysaccharide export system protein LptA
MSRLWGGVGCVLLLMYATVAPATQASPSEGREPRRPTTVTADRLEVSLKEHRAIYTGNVVAKTTDLTVTADRMEFDFDEKMEAVKRMVAVGNVHISQSEGNKAAAERATYYVLEDKVVLEGHAKAWGQGNMVSGTRITLFIKEDRHVAEGDESERVTAVIVPRRQPGQAR